MTEEATITYHGHDHRGRVVVVHRHDGDRGPHGHVKVTWSADSATRCSVSADPDSPREPGESTPMEDMGFEDLRSELAAVWPLHPWDHGRAS